MDGLINLARKAAFAAIILTGSAGTGSALSLTLDFSGETLGAIAGETFTKSQGGLDFTFVGSGLQFRTLPAAFEAQYGLDRWLSTTLDGEPITMTISGGFVNSVRFLNPINGTVGGEVDVISAQAFDAASSLLDSVSNGNEFNTLSGAGIASIVFDDVNTGYVLGQFEIDYDPAVIPLPATLPLLAAGVGGLLAVRRRKAS